MMRPNESSMMTPSCGRYLKRKASCIRQDLLLIKRAGYETDDGKWNACIINDRISCNCDFSPLIKLHAAGDFSSRTENIFDNG